MTERAATRRKVHEGVRHMCEICGLKLSYLPALRAHMRSRHPHAVRPEVVPPCRFCGKQLKNKLVLCAHEHRVHDASYKPDPCRYCGQAFCSPFSLRRHLASVHRGQEANAQAAAVKLERGEMAGKGPEEEAEEREMEDD
jgi:uncharacterized Zn-finger protein